MPPISFLKEMCHILAAILVVEDEAQEISAVVSLKAIVEAVTSQETMKTLNELQRLSQKQSATIYLLKLSKKGSTEMLPQKILQNHGGATRKHHKAT